MRKSLTFGTTIRYIVSSSCFTRKSILLVVRCTCLTLPAFAPPLPDIIGLCKGSRLIVVRPLVHQRECYRAVEHDQGELRQVDLGEDLLPHPRLPRRLFLSKQLV